MATSNTTSNSNSNTMGTAGGILAIAGMLNSAIGSFYAAKTAQYQLKSQASSLKFQSELATINAGIAENDAQYELLAGQRAIAASTMKYGQLKGSARAAMAANGVQLGEGSAAEVIATTDLMKEIDSLTINANAVRASEAQRMRKANLTNTALLTDTSASNTLLSAGSISPMTSAASSLIAGGSNVASYWYKNKKD